ncbi:MAG: hypothetical protein D6765_08090, partial [Bacteroidetes bacterium]
PDYLYLWSTADGHLAGPADSLLSAADSAGTYTLTVTNAANGCSAEFSVEVLADTARPVALADSAALLTCNAPEVTLQGDTLGSDSLLLFLWSTPDGNILAGDSSLAALVNAPGTYLFEVVNLRNGCRDTALSIVQADSTAVAAVIPPVEALSCRNPFAALQVNTPPNPNLLIQWGTLDGSFAAGSHPDTPLVDLPGTYFVSVSDTVQGCSASDTVRVEGFFGVPAFSLQPPPLLDCTRDTVLLQALLTSTDPLESYGWSSPDGALLYGSDSLAAATTQPGTYIFEALDSLSGCSARDTLLVLEDRFPPAVFAGTDTTLTCTRTTHQPAAQVLPDTLPLNLQWTTPDGSILSGGNTLQPTLGAAGTYVLEARNPANGCSAADTLHLAADTLAPTADAGPDRTLTCRDTLALLDGGGSAGTGGLLFEWHTPSGALLSGVQVSVSQAGGYLLSVTDSLNGCSASDSVFVFQNTQAPLAEAGPAPTLDC